MSLYRRGDTIWYKFKFAGQTIRESSKSSSKTIAKDAERTRRRELEMSFNRIPQRKQPPLFAVAAKEWLATKESKAAKTLLGYTQRLRPVVAAFGKRLVCDIAADDILAYWSARQRDGASNRTINYETCCLRGVLRRHKMWLVIAQDFAARDLRLKLEENHDAGRAISTADEGKILDACRTSKAPSLLPLFVFARDTGLRAAETQALRRRDLHLTWNNGAITSGEVIVPLSKTEAGVGRSVPLSADVCGALTLWLSRFPSAGLNSYVFPSHEVRMAKGGQETKITAVQLNVPVQSWQRAWRTALKAAGVHYRWHDLRHSFITRLAENPAVSEQTIRALAGHVSKQMLERYSHIRRHAKQEAIAALQAARAAVPAEGAQKWAQSGEGEEQRAAVTH
ncbi:MAG: tyrosine-type recombinase/integrase [Terriglobales bacterium]